MFEKKSQGKEKSKNSILAFQKILRVREKVRTRFLLFQKKKKKSHGKKKGKNSILTFQKSKRTNKQKQMNKQSNKQTW